jgi:16S rRNA (cytosine967-C5)-methyltransferase
VADQKLLWDSLRRALTRAYGLLAAASTPEATSWGGFRVALRGRAQEWAVRANLATEASSRPEAAGIPGWLSGALGDRALRSGWTDADRSRFLAFQEVAAPVQVRFRPGNDGEACRQRLTASGEAVPSEIAGILQLTGHRGLEAGEDWKNGLVEIQDAASQLSLGRLGLRPGMRVWDVCAGQGGKTLLAASELRGKGALVATDVAEAKLKILKDRVRRSGWQNIRILPWDGMSPPDFGPEVNTRGGFDRVIVDAPCSAIGTWRRDPEGRFRLTPRAMKELAKHQHRLIRLGWEALKTGGKLAYVTCSWLPSEDEEVVEAFVAETGARVEHQELLGLPAFDANTLFVCILEKLR